MSRMSLRACWSTSCARDRATNSTTSRFSPPVHRSVVYGADVVVMAAPAPKCCHLLPEYGDLLGEREGREDLSRRLFLEVDMVDPSEFKEVLAVRGVEVDSYRILHRRSNERPR
jgi:hypothetical protein